MIELMGSRLGYCVSKEIVPCPTCGTDCTKEDNHYTIVDKVELIINRLNGIMGQRDSVYLFMDDITDVLLEILNNEEL